MQRPVEFLICKLKLVKAIGMGEVSSISSKHASSGPRDPLVAKIR